MPVLCNTRYLAPFVSDAELSMMLPQVALAEKMLTEKSGAGNDFLGWMHLPTDYDKAEFARIQAAAEKIRRQSQVLIVIGIGGSYLGARAVIELLRSPYYNALSKDAPEIYFIGNSLSPDALNRTIALCKDRDFSVNVISKSGTTTEPAIAFRVFRKLLIERYGEEGAKERIYATTDRAKGTLKELSDENGYETFVVPDDVGGRYSVLTAVGLLPIAAAGIDIAALMNGAKQAEEALSVPGNACETYAAVRNILSRKGKTVEMFVSYDPAFAMMNEWLKQLFGESEGKDGKGLFPASCIFSTDLHSMGQYIQEGQRILFETVMDIGAPQKDFFIDADPTNFDGLNFLAERGLSEVCRKAMQGTVLAHSEGGVPNLLLEIPRINEAEVGYLLYFFEKACAISGYLLGVNPFNQPGVESYKKNMFALLGKPGYEAEKAALEAKLG